MKPIINAAAITVRERESIVSLLRWARLFELNRTRSSRPLPSLDGAIRTVLRATWTLLFLALRVSVSPHPPDEAAPFQFCQGWSLVESGRAVLGMDRR